jgi:transposase
LTRFLIFRAIFTAESDEVGGVTGASEHPADGLPDTLPRDLASAHAMILAQRETIAAAKTEAKARALEIERLKLQLAKARHERFGQSSERGRLLVEQLELMIEDLEETQAEEETHTEIAAPIKTERQRRIRGPRKLPDNLPVERVVEAAPCACGRCGGMRLRKLGEAVSRTLECEPRRWKIVERVREKFACRDCEAVTEPPAPSHAIPRGFAGPSLLAMILVGKFGDHLPLNRQSDAFAREGIDLDVSTLADWVGACAAALDPILAEIRRHVLAAERLHMDDTTVPVLAKIKARTGRLCAYVRDDRPFGGRGPPAVLFDYSPTRHGEHPRRVLSGWTGIMQADAYAGHNALYAENRKPTPILEAACWAHGRRDFFDLARLAKAPVAIEIVRRIDELFAIERVINGKSPDQRRTARQERSKPLVSALEAYMREQLRRLSPKNRVAKPIRYMLSRWASFIRFLDDGRICLSNNAAERALRCVAVGRRNWTFAGSDEGGRRAAAIYSLVQTCRLNDVDPRAWLADVLARLSDHPAKRVGELTPWSWKTRRNPAAALATVAAA